MEMCLTSLSIPPYLQWENEITIHIQDLSYLAQLVMEGLNRGLQNFEPTVWIDHPHALAQPFKGTSLQ